MAASDTLGGPRGFSLAFSQTMSLGRSAPETAARWAKAISEKRRGRDCAKVRRVSMRLRYTASGGAEGSRRGECWWEGANRGTKSVFGAGVAELVVGFAILDRARRRATDFICLVQCGQADAVHWGASAGLYISPVFWRYIDWLDYSMGTDGKPVLIIRPRNRRTSTL